MFGHKDTCRVVRRRAPPRFTLDAFLRRPPGPGFRGEPGDKVVTEFDFGRRGRPIHLIPLNDGAHMIAFANRALDGSRPTQDTLHFLKEKNYAEGLEYDELPHDAVPAWPELKRALAPRRVKPGPPEPASYAFVSAEEGAGRVLVARRTEWSEGAVLGEMVCFLVEAPIPKVQLPAEGEMSKLAGHAEPLFRAGAAWAMGQTGKPAFQSELRAALGRAQNGAERATIALALARCGDDAGGRKALRAALAGDDGRRAAARALALLGATRADADALIGVLGADPVAAEHATLALARLGPDATPALVKASRSRQAGNRVACARVLALLDDPGAEEQLLALARDRDETVHLAAARALTAPPRAIYPQNHAAFAKALDGCRRHKGKKGGYRLATLAAHAQIQNDKVLKALVDLAPHEPRAIWALAKLTGEPLKTPAACKEWWKKR